MSEIKTCEEYVLNELKELQKDYDKAIELNEQQFYEINELKSKLEDSCVEIKKYKDILKIIARYCEARDEDMIPFENVYDENKDKIETLFMYLHKESKGSNPNKDFVAVFDTLLSLVNELKEEETHD